MKKTNRSYSEMEGMSKKDSNAFIKQLLQAFADELEGWLQQIHASTPIHFAIGLNRISGSDWDKWSKRKIAELMQLANESLQNPENKPTEKFVWENALNLLKNQC